MVGVGPMDQRAMYGWKDGIWGFGRMDGGQTENIMPPVPKGHGMKNINIKKTAKPYIHDKARTVCIIRAMYSSVQLWYHYVMG